VTTAQRELTDADIRATRQAIEYCYEKGWTDGLPVVPAIEEFVQEFLATTSRGGDDVLLTQAHLDRVCTVRHAAINAIMAGCRPEYFPVVIGALDAFESIGGGGGLLQSTMGQAAFLLINGPIRKKIGVNCTENIFGPGDRPNATIGRTIRMIIMQVLGVKPHEFDQSTQGTPAKYSFCIGENEEESPWEPFHVTNGFAAGQSAITIQPARSDLHVEHRSTQVPEEILYTIADSMSYAGGIYEAPPYNRNNGSIIVMCPEHANIIANGGWSKQDVKQFLWENFGKTKRELRRYGKIIGLEDFDEDAFIHSSAGPDSLTLCVSGASNAGVSTVCSTFASRYATALIEERA
jgi:hypothetical protein